MNKVQQQSSSHSWHCEYVILCDLQNIKILFVEQSFHGMRLLWTSVISGYATARVGAVCQYVQEAIHMGIQQSNLCIVRLYYNPYIHSWFMSVVI